MDDLLQQGITEYREGRREEARKIFIAVLKQDPQNFRAWGWMYDVSKNDKERIYCLKQMSLIDPNNKKVSQLLKKLTGSSSRVLHPSVFISVVLVCLIGVCGVGFFFIDTDLVTTTLRSEEPLVSNTQVPIETIIGLTFSAAQMQTAAAYSPTPLFTSTIEPEIIIQPTATLVVYDTPTQPPLLLYTPIPAFETSTPFIYPTLVVAPTLSIGSGGGSCCRVCTTGKPCGDSCISRNNTCTKPRGCAC